MVTVSACRHHAVPRRLAGTVADHPLGRRQLRLVAAALVHRQGDPAGLRLRLAARHAAPAALRPVHAASAGRCCSRSTWSGSSRWPASGSLQTSEDSDAVRWCIIGGVLVVVLLIALLWPGRKRSPPAVAARSRSPRGRPGSFPLPPMDLQVPPSPRARARGRRAGAGQRRRRRRRHDEGGVTWARSPARSRASGSPSRTCSEGRHRPTTRSSRRPPAPRYHGRHILNRHPDGLEKCIGCELCAWACPADAIYVEGGDNTEEQRFSPG